MHQQIVFFVIFIVQFVGVGFTKDFPTIHKHNIQSRFVHYYGTHNTKYYH